MGGYIKFCLKMFGIIFFYLFFAFWLVLAISAIEDDSLVIMRTIFYVCDLLVYVIMMFMIFGKEGEIAIKKRHDNDLTRKRIIETGDDLPLQPAEFKPYMGFIAGLVCALPIIVLWVIYLSIFISTNGTSLGFGHIVNAYIYGVFTQPYLNIIGETAQSYLILIYGAVTTVLICGLGYYLGGMKKQKEYDLAKNIEKEIYGD